MTTVPDEGITILWKPLDSKGHAIVCVRLPSGEHFTDTFNLTSAKARALFTQTAFPDCESLDRDEIRRELDELAAGFLSSSTENPTASPFVIDGVDGESTPLDRTPAEVRDSALEMLRDPNLIQRIVDDVAVMGVAGEREITATLYLIGTSRLLPQPCSGRVYGPTASGKSFQIEKVGELFPPEAVIHAKQMTSQALFHMPPGSLVHRFVIAGERSRLENDDSAETTRALREMISSGRLSKLMPVKAGNEIITRQITQDGPIAFVESTSLSLIFEEDANRCITMHTDERPAQTVRILHEVARTYSGAKQREVSDEIVARHHAAQRLLEPLSVVVPFAQQLAKLLAADRVEARRAIGHLLSLISACALLHQYQRDRNERGAVIATGVDYQIAHRLLDGPLALLLGQSPSPAAQRFAERLRTRIADNQFTTQQAAEGESVTNRAVRGWLVELAGVGEVEQVEPGRGARPAIWKFPNSTSPRSSAAGLPSLERLLGDSDFRLSDKTEPAADIEVAPESQADSEGVPALLGSEPEVARDSGATRRNSNA